MFLFHTVLKGGVVIQPPHATPMLNAVYYHRNFLYIYPMSINFRSNNKQNIGIKVQFMGGEEREDILPIIYGRSNGPAFLREWWCLVHYLNKLVNA